MLYAQTNKTQKETLHKYNLLLDLTISPQKIESINPKLPYILDFKNSKSNFVYVGTKHSNNPKSTQFNKIEFLFRKFLKSNRNKKIVVGIENTIPYNNYKNLSKNQLVKKYRESGLLAYLARKNNLKIICPEPLQDEILDFILTEKKFNELDILSWIYLNMLFSALKREKSLSDAVIKITLMFDQIIKRRWPQKTNEDLIMRVQEKIRKLSGKKISDMNKKELCKLQSPFNSGALSNYIGAEFNIIRDKLIARNFLNILAKGKNVFSVYGYNHVLTQEPVFKKSFLKK